MARFSFLIVSILVLFVMLIALSDNAQADWKWDAIQITCSKDLNYFALRTMALEDVEPKDIEATKRLEQSGIYGIYMHPGVGSILKHPYTCNLPEFTLPPSAGGNKTFPARTITVEAVNKEMSSNSVCSNVDVVIRINGKQVATYLINDCVNDFTDFIQIDTWNQLTECKLSDGPIEDRTCHVRKIKPSDN